MAASKGLDEPKVEMDEHRKSHCTDRAHYYGHQSEDCQRDWFDDPKEVIYRPLYKH